MVHQQIGTTISATTFRGHGPVKGLDLLVDFVECTLLLVTNLLGVDYIYELQCIVNIDRNLNLLLVPLTGLTYVHAPLYSIIKR